MKNIIFTLVLFVMSHFIYGQTSNITLSVDVSQFSGVATLVKVNGGFSGWATAYDLTNTSGSIWEVTVPMNAGTTDYRFEIIDNQDGWNPEWPASNATEECFINGNMRGITVTGDAVIETVCWESCSSCLTASESSMNVASVEIFVYNGNKLIVKGLNEGISEVSIYDIQGKLRIVKTIQVEGGESTLECVQNLSKGIYIIKIETENRLIIKKLMIN